jgi:hypothetical protein
LLIGIVGAALSGLQAYYNRERAEGLLTELDTLQQNQQYSDVAKYGATGLIGIAGRGLKERTPLNDILVSYIHDTQIDSKNLLYLIQWDRTNALKAYNDAIKLEDKLPFPYVYGAACLKKNNTGHWQRYLNTTRKIFVITTQIPGHHRNHDDFLKAIHTGDWVGGVR